MNVSVVDLSANQKKLQVEIPPQRVQRELDKRYRELARNVMIPGFRPGKVPRSILKSYYGKTVENEVSSQFIQDTFAQTLREADLKPLVEADVGEMHFEDSANLGTAGSQVDGQYIPGGLLILKRHESLYAAYS